MDGLTLFVDRVCSYLGQGKIFLVMTAFMTLVCLTNTALALFVKNYNMKKRVWGFLLSAVAIPVQVAFTVRLKGDGTFCVFTVAVYLLLNIPAICIPEKKRVITEEQRQAVRFLESAIEQPPKSVASEYLNKALKRQNVSCEKVMPKESLEEKDYGYGLDFSHVNNVIKRLDYVSLTASDKKQVSELEGTLTEAERVGYSENVKERINDGLGALLKIMSKYGI